eukprot:TRINITY_DN11368_c0_g1_i1.p1 TRINITY_DN11368_c0_g1~~TRINITY_DN11368_c0_g1_i1.p1  ORF type:complete len:320 (-),score=9.42 TRINITY_DN11368_c0_g1_i1:55-1014(-)
MKRRVVGETPARVGSPIIDEAIETGIQFVREKKEQVKEFLLADWERLPDWLKDNEFIHTRYRVNYNVKKCLTSIFEIHNETMSIWTHGLAAIVLAILSIVTLRNVLINPHRKFADIAVFIMFFVAAITQMTSSTVFHIFHCHSDRTYRFTSLLDYSSISLMILGCFVPVLYYFFEKQPQYQVIYMLSTLGFFIVGITLSVWPTFNTPKYRSMRAFYFLLWGWAGLVPFVHVYLAADGSTQEFVHQAVKGILWMGGLYSIGATIYASRVPERFFPGKFDIFGSHSIWHLFTIAAALVHLDTISYMFEWAMSQRQLGIIVN